MDKFLGGALRTVSMTLSTAAMLDATGRFVSNVGVPAAIAFLLLWQLGSKMDQLIVMNTHIDTELAVFGAMCGTHEQHPNVLPLRTERP